MGSAIRTVVTGTVDGRSTVVHDGPLEPITPAAMPGFEYYRVWGSESTPVLPTSGDRPSAATVFPPSFGSRFWLIRFPAAAPAGGESEESVEGGEDLLADLAAVLPGLGDAMEPDHPGMHMTATVDYVVVLEGAIDLELDEGETVRLERGTALVQNGTRHAWRSVTDQPCLVAVAMVGAVRG
jgi:hypothetical protein